MAWTTVSTQVTGTTITAVLWNELVNNMLYLEEVAYQEFTSAKSITVTTEGTAVDVVSSGAINYTAGTYLLEFVCPAATSVSGVSTFLLLQDGATVIGRIGQIRGGGIQALESDRRFTVPGDLTAASHTLKITAHNGAAGTATLDAGTGGSGTLLPGFIRISRIPT